MAVLRQRLFDALEALNAWESSEDVRVAMGHRQRSAA